ncbi:MAG: rubredoxin domain-containing protein [Spirosomataceae bacterium]
MQGYHTVRVNFKGGIVSPKSLKDMLEVAQQFHITKVRFSLRQQLFVYVPYAFMASFSKAMQIQDIALQIDENAYPNLISSYVGEEVFQSGNWLTEGIYQEIFDTFDYEPHLKINLSDNRQSFTPFFSGHLNFVSSDLTNYWYLQVRLPKTNEVHAFERLIYSTELSNVCKILEAHLLNGYHDIASVFEQIPLRSTLPVTQPLQLPAFSLPYYEGFNRYGDKTWLGIYRRDELFSVDFLLELCQLCLDTKIGLICLTPWKSLIIKGISKESRSLWSNLLAKYSINVRHAANELNWQVEDDSPEALALKQLLVRAFDRDDLRTFGICFGIKTIPKTEVFASIMVRQRAWKWLNWIPLFKVYDISYTQDFDPNGRTKLYFAQGITRFNLAEQLRRSVLFYNRKVAENEVKKVEKSLIVNELNKLVSAPQLHQCKHCFTVYDPTFGDELNGVAPGIPFNKLPKTYTCPTCEGAKSDFKIRSLSEIGA